MSLYLNGGTVPQNLRTKSVGHSSLAPALDGEGIHIGDYRLSMQDFCSLVGYVLTNTNSSMKLQKIQRLFLELC